MMATKKSKKKAAKKGAVKKTPPKKKAPIKKAPVKKTPVKKAPEKKAPVKKASDKKTPEKKKTKAEVTNKREPARREPAEMPAGKKSLKPFEVCNYFGVYLRDVFEKEHMQNRSVQLGEVFERLLSDVNGAWNLVKLYGRETPLEKLRGEGNPFHYDL